MIDAELECVRLLEFARASAASPFGFLWLDRSGRPYPTQPVHTWLTTRMTHVYSLAYLQGFPGAAGLAVHGVRALAGALRDQELGGWYDAVSPDGEPADTTKAAYTHAFVVLASTSAVAADVPGSPALLAEALDVTEQHFLDGAGRVVDTLDRDLRSGEDYRGANSSMHMVEAFLAAGDVTGDATWHQRALAIAEHLINGVARPTGYLLPEHYTTDWAPLPQYNAESPGDRFRPFGCTPGHLLEWSRLLLHLEASLPEPPPWLLEDSQALFARAVETAWSVDGEPGFVYTVDWEGHPVIRLRMHWVHAEALAAAGALRRRTGDPSYDGWRATFEDYIGAFLRDEAHGSWHHELDEANRPSETIWRGKPDIYHAYQALLLASMPLSPVLSVQLRETRIAVPAP